MKRKSNSQLPPSKTRTLSFLNGDCGVMIDKAIMQNIKTREVNYEKCNSKINHCKNSRKNQSHFVQRDRTNQKFVSIRNDIIGKNKQRNARQNPKLANSINAIGWLGAIILALSPLFSVVVWCSLAIFGLALLTVQATYNKVNNLIALNIISIITFSIKLIGITT
jgi:hypothetical protein